VAKSDLVAIGMVAYAGGTLALVGSKGIKTVPDFKGKKIASQLGSQTDYVFQNKIMPAFGLKKGDYQVVNVKFRDHVSAMASGSVDGFAGVEPYPSVAEINGLGNIITDYTKYDIVPVILGTNNTVLKTRPDDLVKFMHGWVAASNLCSKEPARAAHIVGNFFRAKGYKMKDDIFKLALSHMDVTPTFKPELKTYLGKVADTMVSRGQLSQAPNLDHALNRSVLKKVGLA
jgi:sulfonate transport system substrate-binding protein